MTSVADAPGPQVKMLSHCMWDCKCIVLLTKFMEIVSKSARLMVRTKQLSQRESEELVWNRHSDL